MSVSLVSILVLSEDSAKDSADTIAALFRHMVRDVEPSCQAHRIDFEPLQNQEARRVLRANVWKSTNPRDQQAIRLLRQSIAEKILETPPGYVLFHVDGDTRWSERGTSQNAASLESRILRQVRVLIGETLAKKKFSEEEIKARTDEAMSRLFVLTPFYSIESWLYQNTRHAVALCDAHHAGQDREHFVEWGADRGLLDEQLRPKEQTCLGARYNFELARTQFPVSEVYGASPSFTEAVNAVAGCGQLISGLQQV